MLLPLITIITTPLRVERSLNLFYSSSKNNVSHMANWETLGKRACVMNASGKCSLDLFGHLIETDRRHRPAVSPI